MHFQNYQKSSNFRQVSTVYKTTPKSDLMHVFDNLKLVYNDFSELTVPSGGFMIFGGKKVFL